MRWWLERQATEVRAVAKGKGGPGKARWNAPKVRALRDHLGFTQEEMAQEIGARQQTISEWETGVYAPRGISKAMLTVIAERADFIYGQDGEERADTRKAGGGEGLGG